MPEDSPQTPAVLTINVGSSSIKFAFFAAEGLLRRILSGQAERLGSGGAALKYQDAEGNSGSSELQSKSTGDAARELFDWFTSRSEFAGVRVISHRVVHGGPKYREPQPVTPEMLDELRRICPMDPDHLPAEIERDRGGTRAFPTFVAGRVFRHLVPFANTLRRAAAADPAEIRGARRPAVRVPRPVLHLPHGGTPAARRRGRGERARDPRAPRQRREHGSCPRREGDRHDDGLYARRQVCQ